MSFRRDLLNPTRKDLMANVDSAEDAIERDRQLFFQNASPENAEERWQCLLSRRKGIVCKCSVCQLLK